MNIEIRLPSPGKKLEPRQRFVLWNVGWDAYEKIVDALNEQHVRVTYDRGDIELMSPLPIHEAIKVWFGHFMLVLAEELDFPVRGVGSPTFRRRILDRGLEPDDCYYLASAAKVVDWVTLNLDRDPPPDLALEVEITSSCLDRMGVYAGLGVPEVWRFEGEQWHIHLLGIAGTYQESSSSAALPYLPIPEIMPVMLQSLHVGDDRERFRILRRWVRERVLPLRQAWQQQTPPAGANP
ncbi:MAG TPA: Uma2 family endonuclease [Gemmataceae bacterium]|nr:Uma2 family endonuclease [Gemmataceae bacterium]